MAVISFANVKGGAGKTTTALLLGMELVRQGYSVAVLDADPQGWIAMWFELSPSNERFTVTTGVTTANLAGHLRRLHNVVDHVLVDLSGASDVLVALTAGLSDLVLVPVQGCALDGRGAARVLELIQYVENNARTRINHAVVLNRVSAVVTTHAITNVVTMLAGRGVPMLRTAIIERSAYRDLFDHGGLLHELDEAKVSNLARARANAESFADEVQALLGHKQNAAAGAPYARFCYQRESRSNLATHANHHAV